MAPVAIVAALRRMTWDAAQVDGQRQIRLVWKECGGPPVADSVPRGFGTKLIERACSYELEGSAELRLTSEGLTAEIVFPVT